MEAQKDKIVRLVKILGKPYNEIVGVFWVNDDIIADTISVTECGKDFELSVFSKSEDYSDWEDIIPSFLLSEDELNNIVEMLEDILMNN